jgi:hypothetical protein
MFAVAVTLTYSNLENLLMDILLFRWLTNRTIAVWEMLKIPIGGRAHLCKTQTVFKRWAS